MPWNSVLPFIIWAAICIPLAVILWIVRSDNKLTAILIILAYLLINVFFFLSVSWAIVDLWLEFAPLILGIVILFRLTGTRKWRKGSFFPKLSAIPLVVLVISIVILLSAGYLVYGAFRSLGYAKDQAVLLLFPVRNGMYVIANGGDGLDGYGVNNAYQNWLGQKTSGDPSISYSADIFKMSDRGYISGGILPSPIDSYQIYDDFVYTPCQGTVLTVEDGHPDVPAYTRTTTDLGNYVVLECGGGLNSNLPNGFEVVLSNLKNQSILVKPNSPVQLGVIVGQVGNSASNSIPHLHIHAVKGDWTKDSPPLPMLFDGAFAVDQFPIRNKIYLP